MPPVRPVPSASPSFLYSDRRLARVVQPLRRFLYIEAAGGIVLILATIAALVWANAWPGSYESLWTTEIDINVGDYEFNEDFGHLVNDLLMGLFFFLVGMEIKRELVHGELRDPRSIALPAMAALGGMVVPAMIYFAANSGSAGKDGWGIPMATDVAFALGVVALLGPRVPSSIKVLLLTLAIVDDIGAIVVIAVFYSSDVEPIFLLYAAGVATLVGLLHNIDVSYPPIFLILGLLLWLMVYESGVHATIAGVVMGLLIPATPRQSASEADRVVDMLANRPDLSAADVRIAAWSIRGSVSACDRLIDSLHPWTSYFVVPLFALANAGVELSGDAISDPSTVLIGVLLGLVVGKFVGISAFSWLAVRLGFGRLPAGARWGHVLGVAAVAGIGFTVSLFITGLAFDDADLESDAKIGTLAGSVIAAVVGWIVFSYAGRGGGEAEEEDQKELVSADV